MISTATLNEVGRVLWILPSKASCCCLMKSPSASQDALIVVGSLKFIRVSALGDGRSLGRPCPPADLRL